jgi:hypothetical protein
MDAFLSGGILWWVTAIELPALAGLLALVLRLRDALAQEKIEAVRAFASISSMKELEQRLVSHLLRIEAKLDTTALKTEALARAGR